jgi:hypothetical protein
MVDETFETFVARERARLHGERDAIFTQQQELDQKLEAVNRELAAIEAYEAAKTGKAPARQSATRRTGTRSTRKTSGAHSGSKRDELLKLIQGNEGLSRAEILERMGLKGNKSGEMSVSNALTALTKSNQVARRDRKYVAA